MTIDQYNFACSQYSDPTLPDDEKERQMYWYVKNTLELNRIHTL